MLIYPSIDSLMKKVDSKYSMVVAAARRTRELMEMENRPAEAGQAKPVTIALREIEKGIISYQPK
ncbi:MAG: DNA-directed RNA polymerase subunit omega [Bacillota bacterium]|jgi:DNA-directed RNA polymerase subunit omega